MTAQGEHTGDFRIADRIIGRRPEDDPVIRLEIYGIVILAFTMILALALLSFDPADVGPIGGTRAQPATNVVGPVGAHVADVFLGALGIGSFLMTGLFGFLGMSYVLGRQWSVTSGEVLGWVGLLVGGSVLFHVSLGDSNILGHDPGGLIGEYVGEVLRALLNGTGAVITALTIVLVSVIRLTRRSVFELAALAAQGAHQGWGWSLALRQRFVNHEPESTEPARTDDETDGAPIVVPEVPTPPREVEGVSGDTPEPPPVELELPVAVSPICQEPEASPDGEERLQDIAIVESDAMRRPVDVDVMAAEQGTLPDLALESEYELPSLSLLGYQPPQARALEPGVLREKARILEETLAHFKVRGEVVQIQPGPVITMYEFKPAPGVKVATIQGLGKDLAMALSALAIRILAPIPGKDVVGIEVPNKARETVFIKEILADPSYGDRASKLTMALGKDIVGNPVSLDLARAPHLLVAGATGSGKSVAVNAFICSILYNATPADVRMIMIDPKIVELSVYEDIPHLLLPVVTDPKQASTALRWAVREMNRRFQVMADMAVRSLASYNQKVEALLAEDEPRLPEKLRLAAFKRAQNGDPDPVGQLFDSQGDPLELLPQIVLVVDELADLMMVAGKEVELSIARLAQKARASGIHLILATQRPTTDVITGLIKANLPSRVAFRVTSGVDSRTILDRHGAETLLGKGDMLYLASGASEVQRCHGCFVDDDEVKAIVAHLKTQGLPDYRHEILVTDEDTDDVGSTGDGVDGDHDKLYDDALRIVAETRNASISYLQRKLKIGYNRAARIVETMEEEGVVGPSDGTSRPREVFVDPV